jgi:hypothetical protein
VTSALEIASGSNARPIALNRIQKLNAARTAPLKRAARISMRQTVRESLAGCLSGDLQCHPTHRQGAGVRQHVHGVAGQHEAAVPRACSKLNRHHQQGQQETDRQGAPLIGTVSGRAAVSVMRVSFRPKRGGWAGLVGAPDFSAHGFCPRFMNLMPVDAPKIM